MQSLLSLLPQVREPSNRQARRPAQPADTGTTARIASRTSAAIIRKSDDRLSFAEAGLLLAAFSTLLCSIMLGVIVL